MVDKRAVIDPNKCDGSPFCPAKGTCPAGAIEQEDQGEPYFVNSYCQGCRKCITACGLRAITMV